MPINKNLTRLKILVVDDDAFTLNLSVRMLNVLGCDKVIIAENGKFAIGYLINAREPGIVVMTKVTSRKIKNKFRINPLGQFDVKRKGMIDIALCN